MAEAAAAVEPVQAPAAEPNAAPAAAAPVPAPAPDPKAAAAPAPAADPKAAPAAGGTDGTAKGYWPDDWVNRVAKGDEKRAKEFGRYQSPEALADAYVNLRRRMDSGEVRPTLPKDPKPDELAAWRKDNGIPEKPEGYELKGIQIPEEDKDIVNNFLSTAHSKNFSPEQAQAAVESYYAIEKRNTEARATRDEEQRTEALDALNQEWGGSFRRNITMVEGLLSKFPESVRDALKSARLPDGTAAFNSPDVLRGFAALALELNPAGIVVRSDGGDLGKSMVDRYNEIQKFRRDDRGAYNKDAKVQEEERNLIDAMVKHGLMDAHGNLTDRKAA